MTDKHVHGVIPCEMVGLEVNEIRGKEPLVVSPGSLDLSLLHYSHQYLDVQTEYNGTLYSFIMVRAES